MVDQDLDARELMTFTYPRPNIKDNTLCDNLPAPLYTSDVTEVVRSPECDLGSLQALPLEVLFLVLSQLDLHAFTTFRRVNRQALVITESIPQYQTIKKHAQNALRGILRVETSHMISHLDLFQTLCTAECEQCGDFGGFLYIPTCSRVCFICLTEHGRYLPLLHSHAIQKFGLSHSIIETLPRIRSIPGIYSPNTKKSRHRHALVDAEAARQAGINLHGSVSAMERYVNNIAGKALQRYNQKVCQYETTGSTISKVRRPRMNDPWDAFSGNIKRFVAVVQMDWFDQSSNELVKGFHCLGCSRQYERPPLYWRRRFNLLSFREHIKRHGIIRDGKHQQV